MNKLTKYACILTTLAGAVACSGGKKSTRRLCHYPSSSRSGDTGQRPVPVETVYPDLLSGR